MPLYEYQCENCGVRFERHQRMAEDPVKVCPDCEGSVHRLIHPVGIIFKGSGFYVTDNRAKSSTASPANKTSAPSEETSSTSSDSSTTTTNSSNSEKSKSKSKSK
ncbi:MAG TPA: FmdB family transcriptional regulator [Chloroflexi bacterium]|nr:FmdB family transcriptional regulator [Chloroflexota bacterium]